MRWPTSAIARKLRRMELMVTGITDRGIACLREAPNLEELVLDGDAGITEACAALLAGMPALRRVTVLEMKAEAAIREKIRTLNPKIEVKGVL